MKKTEILATVNLYNKITKEVNSLRLQGEDYLAELASQPLEVLRDMIENAGALHLLTNVSEIKPIDTITFKQIEGTLKVKVFVGEVHFMTIPLQYGLTEDTKERLRLNRIGYTMFKMAWHSWLNINHEELYIEQIEKMLM